MDDYKVKSSGKSEANQQLVHITSPLQLLHMLAEGPLGQTLLVRDKSSGERRVIKQAECRDYTQAMLAYQQVSSAILWV